MMFQVRQSLDTLARSVKCHDYFSQQGGGQEQDDGASRFWVPNPTWQPEHAEEPRYVPSGGVLECIEAFTSAGMDLARKAVPPKLNMAKRHFDALAELMVRKDVIFSVADKNLGLVVQDVEDYRQACLGWLGKTHTLDTRGPDVVLRATLDHYAGVMHPYLGEHSPLPKWAAKWLTVSLVRLPGSKTQATYRTAAFRVLPKFGKDKLRPKYVEYRPCTGNHCSPTQPGAALVAYWFRPLCLATGSYCKDSDSICRMFEALYIPTAAWIFTVDAVKLYPSIIHNHLILVLDAYLREVEFVYTDICLELLKFILAFNYCEFEGQVYRQHTGFATGVACGAEAAALYLWALERRQLRLCRANIALFTRYIDDGLGAWYGTKAALLAFLNLLYAGSGLRSPTQSR